MPRYSWTVPTWRSGPWRAVRLPSHKHRQQGSSNGRRESSEFFEGVWRRRAARPARLGALAGAQLRAPAWPMADLRIHHPRRGGGRQGHDPRLAADPLDQHRRPAVAAEQLAEQCAERRADRRRTAGREDADGGVRWLRKHALRRIDQPNPHPEPQHRLGPHGLPSRRPPRFSDHGPVQPT